MSHTWGRSFRVPSSTSRLINKAYVGGGPYLAIQTAALFDQRLVNLLGASSAEYVPNSSLEIGNQSRGQTAARITGGYRGDLRLGEADGGIGGLNPLDRLCSERSSRRRIVPQDGAS
jgi:hypothetical protein